MTKDMPNADRFDVRIQQIERALMRTKTQREEGDYRTAAITIGSMLEWLLDAQFTAWDAALWTARNKKKGRARDE